MKPRHLTPAQLTLASLCGSAIALASLPLLRYIRPTDACDCIRWIPAVLIFSIFIAGTLLSAMANRKLRNGVKNHQWPEEQIDRVRSWVEFPYANALLLALFISYAVLWIVYPKNRAIGLAALLLGQALSQLRTALSRPPAKPSNLIAGWRDLSPIHSDYWGQR